MYEIKIFPEAKLAVITYHGFVDLPQIKQSIEELSTHSDFSTEFNGVVDHRLSEIDISYGEVKQLAAFVKSVTQGGKRWAMLVETPKVTALAGVYVEMIKGHHEKFLFSTIEAASEYLEIDLIGYVVLGLSV